MFLQDINRDELTPIRCRFKYAAKIVDVKHDLAESLDKIKVTARKHVITLELPNEYRITLNITHSNFNTLRPAVGKYMLFTDDALHVKCISEAEYLKSYDRE